jgi:hypothetical protein
MRFGTDILRQADVLAAFTEDPPGVTRTYLTPQHRQAGDCIAALMREAGMDASYDALGNVVGRYAADRPGAPVVMTGSHMDSVRNAGRYDGVFGILTAIACVRDLHRRGRRLPFDLEVVAFGDEEGVRFGVTLIGSKAMGGSFGSRLARCEGRRGTTLREALSRSARSRRLARARPARRGRRRSTSSRTSSRTGAPERAVAGASSPRSRAAHDARRGHRLAGHAGTIPDGLAAGCAGGGRRDGARGRARRVGAGRRRRRARRHRRHDRRAPGRDQRDPAAVPFTVDVRSATTSRAGAHRVMQDAFDAIATRRRVKVASDVFYELPRRALRPSLQEAPPRRSRVGGCRCAVCPRAPATTRWCSRPCARSRCCSCAAAPAASATIPTRR